MRTVLLLAIAFGLGSGLGMDPTVRADSCLCFGDLDCDGAVGGIDLNILINRWGPCPHGCESTLCDADLNRSGSVGCDDLVLMLDLWGRCETPVRGSKVMFIGDTQSFDAGPGQFEALGEWIQTRAACHGPFALIAHAGDWWDMDGVPGEPMAVRTHLVDPIRRAGVPWTLSVGNWEFDNLFGCGYPSNHQDRRSVNTLWSTLPMNLVRDEAWFVESSPPDPGCGAICFDDSRYAHAIRFNLNGEMQLAILLPFAPTMNMLEWASELAHANARTPLWIFTHAWLDTNGKMLTADDHLAPSRYMCDQFQLGSPAGTTPLDPWSTEGGIWQTYLQHMPNLKYIFCGHTHNYGPPAVIENCCMEGQAGNKVHQFVINGQAVDQAGGNGLMYILTFDSTNTVVDVETWSPLEDPVAPICATDSSCFTFDVSDCAGDCAP